MTFSAQVPQLLDFDTGRNTAFLPNVAVAAVHRSTAMIDVPELGEEEKKEGEDIEEECECGSLPIDS